MPRGTKYGKVAKGKAVAERLTGGMAIHRSCVWFRAGSADETSSERFAT
jgi:hypothetical protein